MSSRTWAAACAVAVGVLVATARPALANPTTAACTYLEIAATNGKEPAIDADLKPLQRKLKKPPFSVWNTFKKLSGGSATLEPNKPQTLKLQHGAATLMLRDRTEKRVELSVTMDTQKGTRCLDAKPAFNIGDWLLLVCTNTQDEGHILGLTCK
jgi:hypothetical protein